MTINILKSIWNQKAEGVCYSELRSKGLLIHEMNEVNIEQLKPENEIETEIIQVESIESQEKRKQIKEVSLLIISFVVALGESKTSKLRLVVHTFVEHYNEGVMTIRIISARPASKFEQQQYREA